MIRKPYLPLEEPNSSASELVWSLRRRRILAHEARGHTREMLFRILFAGLELVNTRLFLAKCLSYLGGLADFLANDLPLVVLVLLDGVQQSLALRHVVSLCSANARRHVGTHLVLGKLGVMHILCLLVAGRGDEGLDAPCTNASSRTLRSWSGRSNYVSGMIQSRLPWTNLGNLGPAVAGITHLLQPKFLLRRPRRVRPAFLSRGLACRCRAGIVYRGLRLGWRRSSLRSLGRHGGLNLPDRGGWRRSGDWRRRRGGRGLALSWPAGLGRCLGRGRLLRGGSVGGLLGDVHGRLARRRVVLLLGGQAGLGTVGEIHALLLFIATSHLGRVCMCLVAESGD